MRVVSRTGTSSRPSAHNETLRSDRCVHRLVSFLWPDIRQTSASKHCCQATRRMRHAHRQKAFSKCESPDVLPSSSNWMGHHTTGLTNSSRWDLPRAGHLRSTYVGPCRVIQLVSFPSRVTRMASLCTNLFDLFRFSVVRNDRSGCPRFRAFVLT